jgi:hypothetical protein
MEVITHKIPFSVSGFPCMFALKRLDEEHAIFWVFNKEQYKEMGK